MLQSQLLYYQGQWHSNPILLCKYCQDPNYGKSMNNPINTLNGALWFKFEYVSLYGVFMNSHEYITDIYLAI